MRLEVMQLAQTQPTATRALEAFPESLVAGSYEDMPTVTTRPNESVNGVIVRTVNQILETTVDHFSASLGNFGAGIANVSRRAAALAAIGAFATTGLLAAGDAQAAKSGKAACPPGKLELNLVGPGEITPNVTDHLTVQAIACPTTPSKDYGRLKLVELGPLPKEIKTWTVQDLRSDSIQAEHFNVLLTNAQTKHLAAVNKKNKSEGTITLEALDGSNHDKILAISRTALHAPPHTNNGETGKSAPVTTGAPISLITGPSGQPTCPPEQAPGVYLCGDSTVSLDTPYTYQVEVVSSKTYDNASVGIASGPADFSTIQHGVDLQANVPWISGNLDLEFVNTEYITTQGVEVGVNVPQKPGSLLDNYGLYAEEFSLTLAP